MKSITFKRGRDGRYYTYSFNDIYQDEKTYLDELAQFGLMFNMLLCCQRFTAVLTNAKIVGFTDKYGNKILHIY